MKWEEMVEKYPDKWVILENYVLDGSTLISRVVKEVCDDASVDEVFFNYIMQGKDVFKIRTKDTFQNSMSYSLNYIVEII